MFLRYVICAVDIPSGFLLLYVAIIITVVVVYLHDYMYIHTCIPVHTHANTHTVYTCVRASVHQIEGLLKTASALLEDEPPLRPHPLLPYDIIYT